MLDLNPYFFSLLLSVGINLLVFLIAFRLQTDKLTDITYCSTFGIIVMVLFWITEGSNSSYRIAISAMVLLWAFRLGGYLLTRILKKGKDNRFDSFRQSIKGFGGFYTLQAISIWILILPVVAALSANTTQGNVALKSVLFPIGLVIFIVGFFLETIADLQKFRFRNNPSNQGNFMAEGLFSIVRFPNYLGEILVWFGIFLVAVPTLQGLEWLTVISPLWISFLLLKVSGIPYLEASNEERYGHLESFQQYKKSTKMLIPGVY